MKLEIWKPWFRVVFLELGAWEFVLLGFYILLALVLLIRSRRDFQKLIGRPARRRLLLFIGLPVCVAGEPRVVVPSPGIDTDHNRIADTLDDRLGSLAASPGAEEVGHVLDLIVSLPSAPDSSRIATVTGLGGTVERTWSNLLYGMHVRIRADRVPALAEAVGAVLIEENADSGYQRIYVSYNSPRRLHRNRTRTSPPEDKS